MSNTIPNTNLQLNAFDKKIAIKSWEGKEQGAAGVALCYGNHIQYAVPDFDGNLNILTNDLATFQTGHDFKDINKWKVTVVSDLFPQSMKSRFKTKTNFLSAASIGGYNYFFWLADNSWDFYALRTRPDMTVAAMTRIDLSGLVARSINPRSNLAVFDSIRGGLPILNGKLGAVLFAYVNKPEQGCLMPLVLDPATWEDNGRWVPEMPVSGWAGVNNLLPGDYNGVNLVDRYYAISAGLLDQGTYMLSDDAQQQTFTSIAVACRRTGTSGPSCLSLAVDAQQLFGLFESYSVVNALPISGMDDVNTDSGVTIVNSPDGALLATYYDTDDHFVYCTLNPSGKTDSTLGLHAPAWVVATRTTSHSQPRNTPSSVFIPLSPTTGPSPCPLPDTRGGNKSQVYQNCTIQNYITCSFTSSNDGDGHHNPVLVTNYWGCLFSVPGYWTGHLASSNTPYPVLTGATVSMMADSFPVPVPHADIWGADSPSGMVNWAVCNYEYLVGNNTETKLDYNVRSSVGFSMERTDLILGFGARMEYSTESGMGEFISQSDATRQATSFSVTTKGLPFTLAGEDAHSPAELSISPSGTLFASAPPATVNMDLYGVLKRGESTPASSMAIAARPVFDGSSFAAAGEYHTFCYQPGNLLSYEPSALNSCMKALFDKHDDKQSRFIINDTNYDHIYRDGNYLNAIVDLFGVKCFGPGKN